MREQQLARWRLWFLAIRPPTLLAGVGPILLGISMGWKYLAEQNLPVETQHRLAAIVALVLVVLLQSAANLVNDAKDAEKGVDGGQRQGPPRLVQQGLLSAQAVKRAYALLFALAVGLVGGLAFQRKDWLILEVATLCSLVAYAYTAGPLPLAYVALGELVALIFFGPIAVMGTSYLITETIRLDVALWGCGSGLIAAAIMAINNYRDRVGDALAGKKTLATLLGSRAGRALPVIFLVGSCCFLLLYSWQNQKLVWGAAAALLCLLAIVLAVVPLLTGPAVALNVALKRTALFNLLYALVFACLVWI